MTAPTFRSAGAFASGAGPSVTPGLPSGWQAGDLFLMFAGFGRAQTDPVISTPSGWTLLYQAGLACPLVFYRRATSSESAPTLTIANATAVNARIIAIRGANATDWLDAEMSGSSGSSTAFSIAAGNGTERADELVIAAVWWFTSTTSAQASGWSAPGLGTLTEYCDNSSNDGSGYGGFAVVGAPKSTAGDPGAISGTLATASPWQVYRFAIRPVTVEVNVALPAIIMSSAQASVSGSTSVDVALPAITMTAPEAEAQGASGIIGGLPTITMTAPAATVSIGSTPTPTPTPSGAPSVRRGCLVHIQPYDITGGARADIRVSDFGRRVDAAANGMNGVVWEPAIVQSPSVGISLWNGDFTAAINPAAAAMGINLAIVEKSWPASKTFIWIGAPVDIYVGEAGDPWPWPRIFSGRVASYGGAWPRLTLQAEVDVEPFNANVLNLTYAGTGDAEGPDDLRNRVKPLAIGRPSNVEPVLINAVDSVYQFSGYGPIEAVTTLYERGSDFGPKTGDYANYAALVAADIPAGRWATCLAEGLIRLGAPAYGVITGDIRGHRVGSTSPRMTGAIISALADLAGVSGSLIESASIGAIDADKPYPVSLFLDEQVSVLDLAQRLALPCNWQVGVSTVGKLFAADVSLSGTTALTLNAQGRALPQVIASEEMDVSPPYDRTIMGAARCWRVHTSDEIAYQAPLTPRGRYDPTKTYREGDIVESDDGSQWIYINAVAGAGHAPPIWPETENEWWSNLSPPLALSEQLIGYLTNATHIVAADADGNVASFADAGGQFIVSLAGEILTSGVSYAVTSETGVDVSINATTGVYTVNSMSANSGAATLRATYNGVSVLLVYSISKVRQGSNPKLLRAWSNRFGVTYAADGTLEPSSQTTIFYAEQIGTNETVSWSIKDGNGNPRPTSYLSASTGDVVSMTAAQFNAARNGTRSVTVTALIVDGGTVLTDTVSQVMVPAGAAAVGFVQDSPTPAGQYVNQLWYRPGEQLLYRWTGGTWVRVLGDLSGLDSVATTDIDPNAITQTLSSTAARSLTIGSAGAEYPALYCIHELNITTKGGDVHIFADFYNEIFASLGVASINARFALTRGYSSTPLNRADQSSPTPYATYTGNAGVVQVVSPFAGQYWVANGGETLVIVGGPGQVNSLNAVDSPPAGVYTYALWLGAGAVATRTFTKLRQMMRLMEVKR
jgi:hypothetical protein